MLSNLETVLTATTTTMVMEIMVVMVTRVQALVPVVKVPPSSEFDLRSGNATSPLILPDSDFSLADSLVPVSLWFKNCAVFAELEVSFTRSFFALTLLGLGFYTPLENFLLSLLSSKMI